MKFSNMVRIAKATGLSAALALGLSSCSRDYVAAYVYATSSANGLITAYAVDYQSGILTQVAGSPFNSQLGNPILSIPSPNNKFLYTVGGSQNAQVVASAIGSDGKLYGQKTYDLTGTYPTAAAVDSTGTFLYVSYKYEKGFGPNSPGPGGLTIFPINSDGSLGTAVNVNVGVNPVGVTVTVPVQSQNNNVYVYVAEADPAAQSGVVLEYQENVAAGVPSLTPLGNLPAGVTPSAIISDPTGRFVYVSDKSSNQIYGYSIFANGLRRIPSSPYTTGLYPVAMTIDPRGKFLYVVNQNSNSLSGYTINAADGSLGGVVGTTSFSTAAGPTCVTIEPALGIYLYTSNYVDGSVSAGQITPEDGAIKAVADTPFPSSSLPSCVTSVANGSHAGSVVYPQ